MARRIASLTITGISDGLSSHDVIFALEAEHNDRPVRSTFFEEDTIEFLDNSEIIGSKKVDEGYSPQQFVIAALNRARTLGYRVHKVMGYTEHYIGSEKEFHFRQSFLMKGPKIAKSRSKSR